MDRVHRPGKTRLRSARGAERGPGAAWRHDGPIYGRSDGECVGGVWNALKPAAHGWARRQTAGRGRQRRAAEQRS